MTTASTTAEARPDGEAPARRGVVVAHRLLVVAATCAVLVTVVLHLGAALSARATIWSDDEIGPLATSRLIAGVGEPLSLAHLSYYPGWAVVLAPLWWFTEDPGTVYRLAVLLAGLSACATIAPLAAVARRLSVSRPTAVLVAAVVMAAPSRVVLSDYALTEAFFALTVVSTAWLGLRYVERGTWSSAILLSLAAAFTFFTHGRGVVLPIAAVLLFAARARRRTWPVSAVGTVLVLGASAALFSVHRNLSGQLYPPGVDREDATISTVVNGLTGPIATAVSGQTWYALVAWLCLPAFGVLALVPLLRAEWTRRLPAAGAWIAVVTLGALATGTLASANILGSGQDRFDFLIYGRYIDPFLLPLVVAGLALVARGVRRVPAAIAWGAAVLLLAAFVGLAAPGAETGGLWFPMNIAGLLVWEWPAHGSDDPAPFLIASLAAAGIGALVVLAGRQLRVVAVALLAAALVASTWAAQTQVAIPWNRATDTVPASVAAITQVEDALGERVDVAYYTGDAAYTGQNFAQFWLVPRPVRVVDTVGDAARDEIIIGRRSWPEADGSGVRRLIGLSPDQDALWVRPGRLANRLADLGYLEPEPGEELSDPSYGLRVLSEQPEVVRRDDPGTAVVDVVNLGDQTWPVMRSADEPEGAVRLVATWTQGGIARDQVVDLGDGMFPFDVERLEVPLDVPEDLERGSATVTLRLMQESLTWLGDPVGGPVTLEVAVR